MKGGNFITKCCLSLLHTKLHIVTFPEYYKHNQYSDYKRCNNYKTFREQGHNQTEIFEEKKINSRFLENRRNRKILVLTKTILLI